VDFAIFKIASFFPIRVEFGEVYIFNVSHWAFWVPRHLSVGFLTLLVIDLSPSRIRKFNGGLSRLYPRAYRGKVGCKPTSFSACGGKGIHRYSTLNHRALPEPILATNCDNREIEFNLGPTSTPCPINLQHFQELRPRIARIPLIVESRISFFI